MNQQIIWNKISKSWKEFRTTHYSDIKEFLENESGLILDIGCGSGRSFSIDNKYIGIDFSKEMVKIASKYSKENKLNSEVAAADAQFIPFKDESFETVVIIATLHTIKNRKLVLQEVKRVLKSNGKALITVWNKDQPKFFEKEKDGFIPWSAYNVTYQRYYYLYNEKEFEIELKKYFSSVNVKGSKEKAEGKYSFNLIGIVKK